MDFRILDQKRKGITFLINENPESIIIYRKPVKLNGFGEYIEDPYASPVPFSIRCRISKEMRGPEGTALNAVGLNTAGSWFILVDWKTEIYKDDLFEARDRKWRIGAITQLKESGGIIAYEAPLIEAEIIAGAET